jgi:antitoxin FitA
MSKSITIRGVSDETSRELASRAAASGRSLQEYLRLKLDELAHSPDAEVFMARWRQRAEATGSDFSAADLIAARDADRR